MVTATDGTRSNKRIRRTGSPSNAQPANQPAQASAPDVLQLPSSADMAKEAIKTAKTAPQAAKQFVALRQASLPQELSRLYSTLSLKHILLKTKESQLKASVAKLQEPDQLPNSLKFQFSITGAKSLQENQRFKELNESAASIIKDAQTQLKAKIVEAKELALEVHLEEMKPIFIKSILDIVKLGIMHCCRAADHNELTNDAVMKAFILHKIHTVENISNANWNSTQRTFLRHSPFTSVSAFCKTLCNLEYGEKQDADSFCTPHLQSIQKIQAHFPAARNILMDMFLTPWITYLSFTEDQNRKIELEAFTTACLTEQATADASAEMDTDELDNSELIKELISKETKKQTQPLKKIIASLETKLQRFQKPPAKAKNAKGEANKRTKSRSPSPRPKSSTKTQPKLKNKATQPKAGKSTSNNSPRQRSPAPAAAGGSRNATTSAGSAKKNAKKTVRFNVKQKNTRNNANRR